MSLPPLGFLVGANHDPSGRCFLTRNDQPARTAELSFFIPTRLSAYRLSPVANGSCLLFFYQRRRVTRPLQREDLERFKEPRSTPPPVPLLTPV
jgi:hypothetical protein